jgi:hypothetical protein
MGFGLVIGFIELLQLVTASKDYALTVLHTSQTTIGHTWSSHSVTVFISRCLIAASNDGRTVHGLRYQLSQQQLRTTEPQRLSN